MSEKTGDLSLSAFSSRAKEALTQEWSDAITAKITEDELKVILENNYNDYSDVALSRTIGRIRKQIKNKIRIASSTRVRGCLVGSRDKSGKNSPIRYMLLKPDKKHMEVSNFGRKTIHKADEEYQIPVPSLATVMVEYDPEYRTYNLRGIEEFKRESIDQDQLQDILNSAHIESKEITKDMGWSKEKSATPIVIFGDIVNIKPEVTGFIENEDGSKKVAGFHPVWIKAEEGDYQPCFNFALRLKDSSGKYIRCHIEHQRYGVPTLLFEDLNDICKRAVSKYPTDPAKQAENLYEWLGDAKVYVAGVVTQYKETFDSSGKPVTNVEIGVAAMVEQTKAGSSSTTEESKETLSQPSPSTQTPPPKETSQQLPNVSTTPTTSTATTSTSTNMPATVKQAVEDLTLFCEAADIDPTTLTIETIRKKALSRLEGVPDGVILDAIEIIKAAKR